MPPVFLLMGLPASGKSTTARQLASRFPLGVHLNVDHLRQMVVGGLADMDFSNEETARATAIQVRLARQLVSQMVNTYQRAGFAVVIDDFWFQAIPGTPVDLGFGGEPDTGYAFSVPIHRVLLLPDMETHVSRLKARESTESGMGKMLEYAIRTVHPMMTEHPKLGWLVLDTSALNPPGTVELILERCRLTP